MKAELNESNPGALKKVYKDYLDSTANKGTWMSPVLQSEINHLRETNYFRFLIY